MSTSIWSESKAAAAVPLLRGVVGHSSRPPVRPIMGMSLKDYRVIGAALRKCVSAAKVNPRNNKTIAMAHVLTSFLKNEAQLLQRNIALWNVLQL